MSTKRVLRPYGIRSLLSFYLYDGDTFTIECPTGSGRLMNLLRRWA